ncbi:hypothetical protein HELRODRAFT_183757 [Helobdella robusta]|uniref:Uncharacterized protein n=1 Tax=Helobdella robusta TaxID=6412 RepID=T1FK57_HELRO|nr:hypothetical protein HELRODRAFT_183757 [Helobdella robusta]ESO10291.1 hypothetical protein HELRODRAFT_183757 [Helobdella robusta]
MDLEDESGVTCADCSTSETDFWEELCLPLGTRDSSSSSQAVKKYICSKCFTKRKSSTQKYSVDREVLESSLSQLRLLRRNNLLLKLNSSSKTGKPKIQPFLTVILKY